MIKRRKPLEPGKPLKRKTELKPTGFLKSGGPIKPRRKAGPMATVEREARDLLKARSGGVCEVQVPGVCAGMAVVWSHRKRRSQSSKAEMWSLTNGLHGCGPCELYLTDHGSDPHVRAHGWTVHPSDDPALIPVTRCIGEGCDQRTSKAVA